MPRYHMAAMEPPESTIDQAIDAYVTSEQFITDALDWVGVHGWKHPKLVEAICDYYAESPQCATVAEDIMDGAP